MKQKLKYLALFTLCLLAFAALGRWAFMLYNGAAARGVASVPIFLQAEWHGLPLDLATSGYLVAVPFFLVWLSRRVGMPWLPTALRAYSGVVALLVALITVGDAVLYSFWDYKIDATIFNYIGQPEAATQSVSAVFFIVGTLAVIAAAAALFVALWRIVPAGIGRKAPHASLAGDALMLLIGGIIFLCIRGGVGKSTANTGMVYYSNNQFLNHSAVNPVFSLGYSAMHIHNFAGQGHFMSDAECDSLVSQLQISPSGQPSRQLLATRRPNILIVIIEGMGGQFVEAVGGKPGVTPRLNALCKEGVLFTRCYANSYRTDRGTLCILSGFPSFPQLSVMKLPEKTRGLPSIARSLDEAGYETSFLYGGDINFTNMQGYLRATGYRKTTGDTHFTLEQRHTHGWGVTDRIMFAYLLDELRARQASKRPWMETFLTLASHEPWQVPYDRLKGDKKANAMAYTDDCLGRFVDSLKRTPLWRNLLLICLPDHGIGYPDGLTEAHVSRYHIPMLWIGGAVRQPARIDVLCNQTDLAATLLGQLGLPHGQFPLSRDVLAPTYRRPFAFHTYDNGFAFIDSTGATVYDLTARRPLTDTPRPDSRRQQLGKAYLQYCYRLLNELH